MDTKCKPLSKRLERVPASVMFELADRIRSLQQRGIIITDLSFRATGSSISGSYREGSSRGPE